MEEAPQISGEIRNEKGQFVKGVSGNPLGKPKGTISVISRIKQIFEERPEAFESFVAEYMADPANRKHLVEMVDGKPRQNIGLDGGETGLAIQFANVFNKNANTSQETDGSNTE